MNESPSSLPTLPDREDMPADERAAQAAWQKRYAHEVRDIVVHNLIPSPKLTILVVTYRPKDYLIECLQHLRGQTARGAISYEIMIADSGGCEHLRDRTPALCDIDLRLRDGISLNAARNAALAYARGEYVAIVDDDGLVDPTFVEVIGKMFEDPSVAAIRGRIIPKYHPYFNTLASHYDRGDEIVDDDLTTEGHMAIRRRIYLLTGGFPDQLGGHEGIYLVYRLKSMFPSMRSLYVPALIMRHDYYDGFDKLVRKARKYKTIDDKVMAVDDSEEFARYFKAATTGKKPTRALTPELKVARALLDVTRFVVRYAPEWALPKK